MDSQLAFFQIDAFTDRPFGGNPAAVLVLSEPLAPEAMLRIAAEMNLSETAFVAPPDTEGARPIRWFTPTVEVPLCGHATLASAHALLRELGAESPIRFSSASGPLIVHDLGARGLRMDLPADPARHEAPPPGLLDALGLAPAGTRSLRSDKLWVVRVESEKQVRSIRPRFSDLAGVDPGAGALGVAVTAPGEEVDFVSRFLAPWVGVDEDPVTGVAHTTLGPYWAAETGRRELSARQLSARGGSLDVVVDGNRVHLSGQAVTVIRGTILRP